MPTIICKTEQELRDGLAELADQARAISGRAAFDCRWLVFNASYDIQVLEVTSHLLGLPSFGFDYRKYGSRNVVDMAAVLGFNGEGTAILSRGQKALAHRLGIPVHDECNGKDVAALWAAGQADAIAAHCESDVQTLAAMYRRWFGPKAPQALAVDLECVAIDGLQEYRPFIKQDSRLTDPKKVEADIEAKLSRAALDPYLARIVCIGYEAV